MRTRGNEGQSTIEFILTFTVAVGFIFLFFKMATNYTNGFMVHHATFMASRAYLVADSERTSLEEGDDGAIKHAKEVFKKYLPEALIPGFDGVLQENRPSSVPLSVFVGVFVEFHQKFSLGFIGGKDSLTLRSESFLGREPTREESATQVCEAIKSLTVESCEIGVTLDDNGG